MFTTCHIEVFFAVSLLLYRHYRDRFDETPSHTGGVSDAYLQKVKDKRDRDRGVYASSSKDKDRSRATESGEKLYICCMYQFLNVYFSHEVSQLH